MKENLCRYDNKPCDQQRKLCEEDTYVGPDKISNRIGLHAVRSKLQCPRSLSSELKKRLCLEEA